MDREGRFAKPPTLEFFDRPGAPGLAAVEESLAKEIASRFGPRAETPFSIVASENGASVGGLEGVSHWRWLYVRRLWVAEDWRRRGLGRMLLAEAERKARDRGCVGIYLDTFDKDAAGFYEKCGFAMCGRIDNFPPGAQRIFLSKSLAA